jgi:hypothetical protein
MEVERCYNVAWKPDQLSDSLKPVTILEIFKLYDIICIR